MILDNQFRISSYNPATLAIMGYKKDELPQRFFSTLLENPKEFDSITASLRDKGEVSSKELILVAKNGEKRTTLASFFDIRNDQDQIIGTNHKLLIGATDLSLEETVEAIHDIGGFAVASHIDRQSFGIIGQVGFIPEGLKLDALEISPRAGFKSWEDFPIITSSDAHFLDDIGKGFTTFFAEEASLDGMNKSLFAKNGRSGGAR